MAMLWEDRKFLTWVSFFFSNLQELLPYLEISLLAMELETMRMVLLLFILLNRMLLFFFEHGIGDDENDVSNVNAADK